LIIFTASAAASLVERRATHMKREASSTIRRKYRRPPGVAGVTGPHRSAWTSSSGSSVRY